MKKQVAFYGGYTIWSAGDDAPLAFLTRELKKVYGDRFDFVVFARHPDEAFDRHYGVRTIQNFEYPSKELSAGKWMRGLNYDDDREELRVIADTIAASDLLVLGAGNFITEVSLDVLRGHFAQFAMLTLIAEMAGTPTLLYGLSANKLEHPWTVRAAQWMLHHASQVTFRDHAAVRNLEASGVALPSHEVLPDAVLGAPAASAERGAQILRGEGIPAGRGARLALSVRDLAWKGYHAPYEQTLVEVLDAWCEHPDRDVLCIPQCTYRVENPRTDDRYIAAELRGKLRHPEKVHLVDGQYPSGDIEVLYADCQVALTTRLHGCVYAVKQGAPPVGIAYEDKVTGFFEQLGLDEWCVPLGTPAATILARLHDAFAERERLVSHNREVVARLRPELSRYVEMAAELLDLAPDPS